MPILNEQQRKTLKKFLGIATAVCVLIAVFLGAWVAVDVAQYIRKPGDMLSKSILITVPSRQPLKSTAEALFEVKAIRQPLYFYLYARISGYGQQIKAGEYKISAAMTPRQILEMMASGKIYLHRVTVPEGYTLQEIADVVARAGLVSESAFLKAARNPELLHQMKIDADTAEGYLFPDTYYFPIDVGTEKIIETMVQRFHKVFTPDMARQAEAEGMTVHQVVTLASIIEKETGDDRERPLVSSVFHNRLAIGMKLESDPTVIYGIDHFSGNLTRQQLTTPTPYNTYTCHGLPPGPIASPGLKSILAAIHPAKTDYLYFVARKDKTHQFSRTLAEHVKAVRQYQLGKG